MASVAPADTASRARREVAHVVRSRWVIGLLLCWAIASRFAWDMPFNNDVSWQLWVARQLRHGAIFYRDITEPNPPLWFWEAVPLDSLAEHLGVATRHVLAAAIIGQVTVAAGLIAALSPAYCVRRAVAAAALLIGMSLLSFGEREHLMAIAALPYAMLIARRADKAALPAGLVVVTGLFAGLGVALKPHFLLIPLALEAWLFLRLRRDWRPVRGETIALTILLTTYVAAAVLFARAYFTNEIPDLLTAYGDFKPSYISLWLGQIYEPEWVLAALAWTVARRRATVAVATSGIVTLAFLISYAVQAKGFGYHALPVSIGSAWTCWLILEIENRRGARAVAILAMAIAAFTTIAVGPFRPSTLGTITQRMRALPPGSTVAVISAHSWNSFPLVEDQRFLWPMRRISEWTMPAIARTGSSTPFAQRTRDAIVEDLWCHPPDVILFDDPARSPAMPRNGFDYRRFVASDPRAADLLSHYRDVDRVGGATLVMRKDALSPRGGDCRTVALRPDFD